MGVRTFGRYIEVIYTGSQANLEWGYVGPESVTRY